MVFIGSKWSPMSLCDPKTCFTHPLQSPSFFLLCIISQPHSQFPADIVWCHGPGFLLILSSLPGPLLPTQLPFKILPSCWALSPPASASPGAHSECFKSTQWITISISQPSGHKPVLSLAWGSLRGMTWVSSIFVCLGPSRAPDKSTVLRKCMLDACIKDGELWVNKENIYKLQFAPPDMAVTLTPLRSFRTLETSSLSTLQNRT